ncbi:MAG: HD domain-containing protein, partial [Clostridia bacterium]|nr:HD domain-containing protein [Clostridia bacterium]
MFRRIKDINKKIVNIFKKVVLRKKVYELDDFNYEKLEKLMSDKGTLQEFKNDLDNFSEIDNLMQNNTRLHGTNHVLRVVFNTYALATLENISEEDKKIIIAAAKLHDIGKVADGEDRAHGETSANKAKVVLKEKGYTQEEIEQICFIIKEHSLPKDKNIEDIENLPQELKERYKRNLNMLKDADKLDRVRLGDLDQSRLTTSSAKRLIPISMDNFRENRYYYEVKPKIYYFNVEQAKEILDFIKEANPNIDIEFKDIRNKYSIYKSLQEQGKLKWIELYKNNIKEDMSIDVFIDINTGMNR